MQRNLTIYYTTDTHGYFTPTDYATGKTIPSGLANCMRRFSHDGNTLVIDGGDTLQGSPLTSYIYSAPRGECIPARIMNMGGYNFVTLGNHDFNYGRGEIERYLNELDAVCLCANVEGVRGVERTALVTLENGLRVGLTGAVTHYVNQWEAPENLEGIRISDAFTAVRGALDELKAAGADVTVCIYHGGFERDVRTGEAVSATDENQGWRICSELDFDVVLAAHQHMAAEDLCIGGTFACQPPDRARQYIRMDVTECAGKVTARSALLPAGDEPLAAAVEYLAPYERAAAQWLDTPVGHIDVPLYPAGHLEMALNGSYIANFINQVQLEASGADVSAASLDNSVKGFAQDVTVRDIVSTYVFPNTLKTVSIDRAGLKRALERSAEYFTLGQDGKPAISETFLRPVEQHFNYDYVAGVHATFDLRRPVGDRVTSIIYEGEELAEDARLTVCINSYRAGGSGGYGVYAECPTVREGQDEIAQLITDYVRRHENIVVDKTKWLKVIY